MNVALMASAFHPHIGGVEEVVWQLAQQQTANGEQPLIVTNRWPKDLPAQELIEGVPVRRFIFRVPENSWRQMGGALLFQEFTLRHLCSELLKHHAEIINVHCVSSNAYYALRARRRLGLPLVVTLHSELTMDASGLFQRSEFARSLMREVLHEAEAITAVSERTLLDAEEFYGKSLRMRAEVIMNGMNPRDMENASPYTHNRPYILAMGRLVPQKGFDVLLRAFAESGVMTYDLLIAGDGSETDYLKNLTAQLKLAGRVHLLGRADRQKARSLMKGCAFFVLPSCANEGLPMVLMEAMTAGQAVAASSVGGVPELVQHERTGLLVDGGQVQQLAAAIRRLSHDSALCVQLGENARRRVSAFDWAAVSRQYAAIYNQVASKR